MSSCLVCKQQALRLRNAVTRPADSARGRRLNRPPYPAGKIAVAYTGRNNQSRFRPLFRRSRPMRANRLNTRFARPAAQVAAHPRSLGLLGPTFLPNKYTLTGRWWRRRVAAACRSLRESPLRPLLPRLSAVASVALHAVGASGSRKRETFTSCPVPPSGPHSRRQKLPSGWRSGGWRALDRTGNTWGAAVYYTA